MVWPPEKPSPRVLQVVVQELDLNPILMTLCAGYEDGEWRSDVLARHLIDWLPQFALTRQEYEAISGANLARTLADVARRIYTTDKYGRRGEFGEVLLHLAIRQEFDTIPVISKFFYKSAENETVKGFDGVHVVCHGDNLELWLGEAKFYQNVNSAIKDVIKELHQHTEKNYLKSEFAIIQRKIDGDFPNADKLRLLLDKTTPIDEVFTSLVFPVLLTYDSETVEKHASRTKEYLNDLKIEVLAHHQTFLDENPPEGAVIKLFLVPLERIKVLRQKLDELLKAAQFLG